MTTVAGPALRSTPGGPHLPPSPFLSRAVGEEGEGEGSSDDSAPASVNNAKDTITLLPQRRSRARGESNPQHLALPARQRERVADDGTERWPLNAMIAGARYETHQKCEFLITLLEAGWESTLATQSSPIDTGGSYEPQTLSAMVSHSQRDHYWYPGPGVGGNGDCAVLKL